MPCQAVQHADRMICEPCGLNWDTNDPSPPVCETFGTLGTSSVLTFNAPPIEWLTFYPCGLRISFKTGEVIIPEGLSLDEASLAFWYGLRQYYGR